MSPQLSPSVTVFDSVPTSSNAMLLPRSSLGFRRLNLSLIFHLSLSTLSQSATASGSGSKSLGRSEWHWHTGCAQRSRCLFKALQVLQRTGLVFNLHSNVFQALQALTVCNIVPYLLCCYERRRSWGRTSNTPFYIFRISPESSECFYHPFILSLLTLSRRSVTRRPLVPLLCRVFQVRYGRCTELTLPLQRFPRTSNSLYEPLFLQASFPSSPGQEWCLAPSSCRMVALGNANPLEVYRVYPASS